MSLNMGDKLIIDNTDEFKFMYKLDKELNNNIIKIIRTNKKNKILYDPYCCVDYVILYKNEILCYIELKSRKKSLKYYYGLLIGSTKLYNIDKLEYHTLIVWEDLTDTYWCEYSREILKLPDKLCNNSLCKTIPNLYIHNTSITSKINSYIRTA